MNHFLSSGTSKDAERIENHREDEQKQSERKSNQKTSSAPLIDSYKSGLYLFGFIKVKKGKPFERFFWVIGMTLIMAFTIYMVYQDTYRYFSYNIRTEVRHKEIAKRALPVITLCMPSPFEKNLYCHNNVSVSPHFKCKENRLKAAMQYIDSHGTKRKGKFLGNGCYVFNENGTIQVATGKESQRVEFYSKDYGLIITFQSYDEYISRKRIMYLTQFENYLKFVPGAYGIKIQETNTKRLPAPYTSECVDTPGNIFSKKNTHASCKEVCAFTNMLVNCDSIIDIWKSHHGSRKPFDNSTNSSRNECLTKFTHEARHHALPNCTCSPECKETTYKTSWENYGPTQKVSGYNKWLLVFFNEGAVTDVKLHPDYPLAEYLGGFGGVLGLGAKLMTLLQLLVFLFLCGKHFVVRE